MRSISTMRGDGGETSLAGGVRVSKGSLRVETYGTVDELNSSLALARSICEDARDRGVHEGRQQDLFRIGSSLATPAESPKPQIVIDPALTERLTDEVHRLEAIERDARRLVDPGGTPGGRRLRRRAHDLPAGRALARAFSGIRCRSSAARFSQHVNRLSDVLGSSARKLEHDAPGASGSLRDVTGKAGNRFYAPGSRSDGMEAMEPGRHDATARLDRAAAGRPERRELGAAAGDSRAHRVHVPEHHGDVVCAGTRRSRSSACLDLLPLSAGRATLPKVGTFLKPDAETIARLKPDLVFIHAGPQHGRRPARQARARDRRRRSRVVVERVCHHPADQRAAAGVLDRGEAAARRRGMPGSIASRHRSLAARAQDPDCRRTPDGNALGHSLPWARVRMLERHRRHCRWIERARIGQPEYPRISMETVISSAPDVIARRGRDG